MGQVMFDMMNLRAQRVTWERRAQAVLNRSGVPNIA
jgi:hypothetical protein